MNDSERKRKKADAAVSGRYPAPRRPQQPMHGPPSPWPWLIGGGFITLAVVLVPFVLYVLAAGHPG